MNNVSNVTLTGGDRVEKTHIVILVWKHSVTAGALMSNIPAIK